MEFQFKCFDLYRRIRDFREKYLMVVAYSND